MALFALRGQAPRILTLATPWRAGDRILLCSDGFARLVDTFAAFASYRSLADAVSCDGPEHWIGRLRALEEDDPRGLAHPRLKRSDDASCVLLGLDAQPAPEVR